MAYQWRKNGAVLPGATASSFQIAVVSQSDAGAYSVVVTNAGGQVLSASAQLTVTAPGPVATTYTTFGGQALPLYAWEGVHTAILTASPGRDPVVMAKLLAAADGTYAYYKAATGYTPGPAKTYNGKLTIAEVPTTCGAGCGYLGATGIELQTGTFAVGYDAVRLNNQYDQAAFYEFGRNFWFLGPRLEYVAPDNSGGAVTTGFAVFMRFMAMDVQGLPGAPYYAWSYPEFRTRVEAMVDLYQADPTQTWSNTLRLGHPQANNPSGLGATDLFASCCFRLRRDYGGDAFIAKLWKEAALRPTAANTQGAVDNFFLASCAAAGRNLTPLFETAWRWPLSAAAKAEAASRFPL
jgi:hypothetical protein